MIKIRVTLPIVIILICCATNAFSQNLPDKRITVEANNQRLADVLKQISSKGNFYFSYNSNIINPDSVVSISANNKPLKQVLDQLCSNRFTWQQSNNYIILRKTVVSPAVITNQTPSAEKIYTVTGIVLNSETGEKVSNVSIYEKERLASTLTDDKGFFKIKLKSRYSTASLTISREMFEDTTVVIKPKFDQQLTIVMTPVSASEPVVTIISPIENEQPDTIVVKPPTDTITSTALVREQIQVEKTKWGKFLLSAKQNVQSINLKKFFADRSFQLSLTPGLSSHGKLSAQVVNNFSINIVGGYTAGVSGIELGGAFNINKKDVKYIQAAGMLNITGGSVTGVQLAGMHNHVLKDVAGLQASGISNFVKGNVSGVQLSSIYNHVGGSFIGLQSSNISNHVNKNLTGVQLSSLFNHVTDTLTGLQATNILNFAGNVRGAQLATIGNITRGELKGLQVSNLFNYAKKLSGVQIGLVNISDTSDGYSIGLVNIVFKGYHKLILSTNEVLDVNAAFKTGNSKLYSILITGYRKRKEDSSGIIAFGYGLGHEFAIGKRFSINPEFTSQHLSQGNRKFDNVMNKLHVQFNVKLGKYVSLFAGPSITILYSERQKDGTDNKFPLLSPSYHTFDLWGNNVTGWIGWNAGISIF